MGKKQHSKDRMFITKTEWATEWGGAKNRELRTPFKRLPFYCCALTFTPFKTPVCTADGSIFEIMYIVPYIVKYGKHPVTGTPLKQEDLIPLNFHKNSEGLLFFFPSMLFLAGICSLSSVHGGGSIRMTY
ncbi:Peptidyl-prolyl cis-trans isomerase CYP65 [Linum perenne]